MKIQEVKSYSFDEGTKRIRLEERLGSGVRVCAGIPGTGRRTGEQRLWNA